MKNGIEMEFQLVGLDYDNYKIYLIIRTNKGMFFINFLKFLIKIHILFGVIINMLYFKLC